MLIDPNTFSLQALFAAILAIGAFFVYFEIKDLISDIKIFRKYKSIEHKDCFCVRNHIALWIARRF